MRARRLLEKSTKTHACLLCSSRLTREASVRQSQQRYLQYSRPSSKPPSAAEAIREEDEGSFQSYGQQLVGFEQNGVDGPRGCSGWASQRASTYLTPEEQQQREALMLRHRPAVSYQQSVAGSRFSASRKDLPQRPSAPSRLKGSFPAPEPAKRDLTRSGFARAAPEKPFKLNVRRVIPEPSGNGFKGFRKVNSGSPYFGETSQIKTSQKYEGRRARSMSSDFVGLTHKSRQLERQSSKTNQLQEGQAWRPNFISKTPEDAQKERREFLAKRAVGTSWVQDQVAWKPVVASFDSYPDPDPSDAISATEFSNDDSIDEVQLEKQLRRAQKFDLDIEHLEINRADIVRKRGSGRARQRESREDEYDDDFDLDDSRAAISRERKRERKREKLAKKKAERKTGGPPTPILLPEFISVENLAHVLRVKPEDFTRKLTELGFEETSYDHVLNAETAGLIAMEYNYAPLTDQGQSEDLFARPPVEDTSNLPPRPPVVTIMGHVDHGKTTILDWLRKSSVAASEHGGITQHIGAFSVSMPSGKLITFLDTPGHAAFLSMRQRGANVTDVVVLVVAADDSVKPQTIEAIKHAKDAKVPIIVAVNKIDKEGANVARVKQDLARHGVEVEDYGGDTQVVCVSGKTGQGMEDLEEAVVTLSEILDMRAETDGPAEGWVLEASTKKEGRVATILVRRGTLCVGDVAVAGQTWARVRRLRNEAGMDVSAAGPGTPVEVDGWKEQPSAGDEMLQAPDEGKARSVVEYRIEQAEQLKLAADMEAINESRRMEHEKRTDPINAGEERDAQIKDLNSRSKLKEVFFVVKGDVSGSVEAVLNSVLSLGNEEVRPHILRSGVGPVSEFDVERAAAANGHIISFNTAIESHISRLAESSNVAIMDHNIIYKLADDVKAKLSEKLSPIITQRVTGEAEIAQIFDINVKGRINKPIAGCKVRNGMVTRSAKVRVLRGKEIVYYGSIISLKNVKKDVTEVRKGGECGVGFEDWNDFHIGDQVQCYEEVIEKRSL